MLLLGCHIALEHARWQMFFAYCAVALVCFWRVLPAQRQLASKKQFATLIALSALSSTLLSMAVPIAELPAPTGPLPIGTSYAEFCDESRTETLVNSAQKRKFMAQIWYPCDPVPNDALAPYMQAYSDSSPFKESFIASILASHLPLIKSHSFFNAKVSNSESAYPILIFSHGMMGGGFQNTVLAEHLASHGYIVVAPNHTYDCAFAIFPKETVCSLLLTTIPPPISLIAKTGLEERIGDVKFLIGELSNPNSKQMNLDIQTHASLDRIGIYGHSLGGQTSLLSAAGDIRIKAVASLDGVSRKTGGITQPVLLLLADRKPPEIRAYINEFTSELKGTRDILTCKNFGHADFTDLILLTPFHWVVGLSGRVSPQTAIDTVNTQVLSFFDKHLKKAKSSSEAAS